MAKVRVRRNDPCRCLVTEVLPEETPIIFSNDGFYLHARKHEQGRRPSTPVFDLLVRQDAGFDKRRYIPYTYRVRKDAVSHRSLSVVHVGAQWQAVRFYQEMSHLVLNYARRSRLSIRAPMAIARTYYIKSSISDLGRFKKSPVSAHGFDEFLKHSPSYFSYRGFSRLYKFFDSTDFLELEKKFPLLWMLDVTKCFDSIYTHSIAWATKDKPFAKSNDRIQFFANTFDSLMQSMNYGETSGIVIGPELSRIFAEVLLQRVDLEVVSALEERGFSLGVQYHVRRYVDDFFVFAESKSVASVVCEVVADKLSGYKLSVNEAKFKRYERPFLTEKSKVIIDAGKALNKFISSMSQEITVDGGNYLSPKRIYRLDRFILSFCNEIKLCCANNDCSYDEVAGYLISALKNRAVRVMDSFGRSHDDCQVYTDALAALVEVALFLYSVAPSAGASYKLCAMIVMIARFADKSLVDHAPSIKQLVFDRVFSILARWAVSSQTRNFVDLESQNLLLAISDLGSDYRLPAAAINRIFDFDSLGSVSYFDLVTLLFYIKDDPQYAAVRRLAMDKVDEALLDLSDVRENSEKVLMLLDVLTCPYIDVQRRKSILSGLIKAKNVSVDHSIDEVFADLTSPWWFVNWDEVDLLNMLERRELHTVY
jgi:hypothetical protein